MIVNDAGLSCPSGGSFYICAGNTTEFIGCCTSNPCTDARQGECPDDDLRNSTFSASAYEDIAPQDCSSTTGLWYTCNFTNPPFLGCCERNPCHYGSCPTEDLVPAKLSTNSSRRALFLSYASGTETTSTPSNITAVATVSASTTSRSSKEKSGISTGTIVGIAVGAAAAIIFVIAVLFIWWRKHKNRRSPGSGYMKPPVTAHPISQVQQPQQPQQPTSPSASVGYGTGPSPPIGGYLPQHQYTDNPNSGMPTPMMDNRQMFIQQSVSRGSPNFSSQDSGYQSVSALPRGHVNAQYLSGVSFSSNGQPSPGYTPSYIQTVPELSGEAIGRLPIVQTSPQEMPTVAGHQLHPAPAYKENSGAQC